jgi:ADP-ribosylation factor 2-binding protein
MYHVPIKFSEKKEKLEGEVFDVLLRITDFLAFKDMFLDYRAVCTKSVKKKYLVYAFVFKNKKMFFQMKEGKVKDLSCGILITPLKRYYTDELPE